MSVAKLIAELPDETRMSVTVGAGSLTAGELREAFRSDGPQVLTTVEASERFGYKPDTWAAWASEGKVRGAWRDRMWRLPLAGCEAHIAELRRSPARKRRPWPSALTSRTSSAPASIGRADGGA